MGARASRGTQHTQKQAADGGAAAGRGTMLFSQSVSLVLEALTMSEMKEGQLCGHSCLTTCTRITLSLLINSFWAR